MDTNTMQGDSNPGLAMTSPSDFRRTSDGWIDFDHYRRAAARERTEARRRAFKGAADALGTAAAFAAVQWKRAFSLPPSRTLTGRPSR
jgi:hypothetical protein